MAMRFDDGIGRIRFCADYSIRRAMFFATLGITTVMAGLAYDFPMALRAGAILTSLMVFVLWLKAQGAPRRSYRATETWLLLDQHHGLPEARAQAVIGSVLRDRYRWHADLAGVAALVLWISQTIAYWSTR